MTTTTNLTLDDLNVGDRLVLQQKTRGFAAPDGTLATVTGFHEGGTTVLVKWDDHESISPLLNKQNDGDYNPKDFVLVAPITVEDRDGLDALPIGTVLRLATDHLYVEKVEPREYSGYFANGQEPYEYAWARSIYSTLNSESAASPKTMVEGTGWLPATIVNPEILGLFTEYVAPPFPVGTLVKVIDGPSHERGQKGEVIELNPGNGDEIKVRFESGLELTYGNAHVEALPVPIYAKGDRVLVDYPSDVWNGPGTVTEDYFDTNHSVLVRPDSYNSVGGFAASQVSPLVEAVDVQVIEDEIPPAKYVEGDKLVVTGETGTSHVFPVGAIVTVQDGRDSDLEYYVEGIDVDGEDDEDYVSEADLISFEEAIEKATALVLA